MNINISKKELSKYFYIEVQNLFYYGYIISDKTISNSNIIDSYILDNSNFNNVIASIYYFINEDGSENKNITIENESYKEDIESIFQTYVSELLNMDLDNDDSNEIISLRDKKIVYTIDFEYNDITMSGNINLENNKSILKVSGELKTADENIGNLYYRISDKNMISRNLIDISSNREQDVENFITELIYQVKENLK